MTLQDVLNKVLLGPATPQLAISTAEPNVPTINVHDVTSILKGRRLRKSRKAFRSFNSPPGRF